MLLPVGICVKTLDDRKIEIGSNTERMRVSISAVSKFLENFENKKLINIILPFFISNRLFYWLIYEILKPDTPLPDGTKAYSQT